jgi:molybdate transport system substrate-binding protein
MIRRAARLRRVTVLTLLVAALALAGMRAAMAEDLLVLAAASLKNALDEANVAYRKQAGTKVVAAYAASGTLAKQIENAVPADLFISADENWMNYVAERKLIKPATRIDLLGNKLVLVAPKNGPAKVEIRQGLDLAKLLGDRRLAIGDPASVPAGTYGKTALTNLGVWDSVQSKLAPTGDVRQALALVSREEAPFGIVYATDAAADAGVKIVAEFPADSYPPVTYPIAVLARSRKPEAENFLAWLRTPAAAPHFTRRGFTVVK